MSGAVSGASVEIMRTRWSTWRLKFLLPVIIASLFGLAAFQIYEQRPTMPKTIIVGNHMGVCIENFLRLVSLDHPSVEELYRINGLCYDSTMSQVTLEEQAVQRDNFIFQRAENVALLVMVICITISGVGLSGVQLLTSYKLAVLGLSKSLDANEGSVSFRNGSLIVKSSVVGVLILSISFAFFMVFVVYVYTMHDFRGTVPNANSEKNASTAYSANFTLLNQRPPSATVPALSQGATN